MSVTWRQGRVTQVVCLPEEAGCFPVAVGLYFTQLGCHLLLPLCTPCPRKWADWERVVGCQRAWEDHLHARSSYMASPVMPGRNGEMWRRLGAAGLMTFLPAHSHPAYSFLFLCVLANKHWLLSEKVSLLFRQNVCLSATGNTLVPRTPIRRGK